MKKINEMKQKDLLNLLKLHRLLSFNRITYNTKEKEKNFGFEISIDRLFNDVFYNTLRSISLEKTENYEEYGFTFIEYLFKIKNYNETLFIRDLKNKVKFIENITFELNQLNKFQTYLKDFNLMLFNLNKNSYRSFFFITCDDSKGLYVEFIDNENIKQEKYNNFLNKYDELLEDYEYTMIF